MHLNTASMIVVHAILMTLWTVSVALAVQIDGWLIRKKTPTGKDVEAMMSEVYIVLFGTVLYLISCISPALLPISAWKNPPEIMMATTLQLPMILTIIVNVFPPRRGILMQRTIIYLMLYGIAIFTTAILVTLRLAGSTIIPWM